jgi:hypothetical protein
MTALFALTIFTGSALIFAVQPMFTKMVLPLLGGTPAVWNTAMMFFQAALLAGYAYAHWASRALGFRSHAALPIGLMAAALTTLPFAVGADARPPADANPVFWLIGLLAVSVGLPFTIVAANATLLQRWFARTDHAAAANPYFLYSASNLGSMLALLAYPSAIEPLLTLGRQSRTWMAAFVALAVLTAACALTAARRAGPEPTAAPTTALAPLSWAQRGHWVLLSFAPSSLLLGLTTYLTTDIAAVPLLWVIPLALYLLTFVIVFARRPAIGHDRAVLLQPFFLLPLLIFMFWGGNAAVAVLYPLHLIVFFLTALVCHGELARLRPAPGHLTEFYLWLSVGGDRGCRRGRRGRVGQAPRRGERRGVGGILESGTRVVDLADVDRDRRHAGERREPGRHHDEDDAATVADGARQSQEWRCGHRWLTSPASSRWLGGCR